MSNKLGTCLERSHYCIFQEQLISSSCLPPPPPFTGRQSEANSTVPIVLKCAYNDKIQLLIRQIKSSKMPVFAMHLSVTELCLQNGYPSPQTAAKCQMAGGPLDRRSEWFQDCQRRGTHGHIAHSGQKQMSTAHAEGPLS